MRANRKNEAYAMLRKKKFDYLKKIDPEKGRRLFTFDLMESFDKGQAKVVGDTLQIISKNENS